MKKSLSIVLWAWMWLCPAWASQPNIHLPVRVSIENHMPEAIELNVAHSSAYHAGDESQGNDDLSTGLHIAPQGHMDLQITHRYDADDYWYINFSTPHGYFSSALVQCDLEDRDWRQATQVHLIIHEDGKAFDIITPSQRCASLRLYSVRDDASSS